MKEDSRTPQSLFTQRQENALAFDQHVATGTKHAAALSAAKAAAAEEKAAPGSRADIEHAEGLWRMLRTFVKVAAEECEEALGLNAAGNTTT